VDERGTKVEARAKLAQINVKIGYPRRWRDYSKLVISPPTCRHVKRAVKFENDRKLAHWAAQSTATNGR